MSVLTAFDADALISLLSRIDLHPMDASISRLAVALATSYGLHAADAVHLATAVAGGADRFVTNNRKDFPLSISEVEITYPEMLTSAPA